jgi:hypothetical protein
VWQSEKVIVNSVIPESQFQLEVQMNGELSCHTIAVIWNFQLAILLIGKFFRLTTFSFKAVDVAKFNYATTVLESYSYEVLSLFLMF